jgi:CoA:oxalate CoA-transferase
MPRPLEDLTVLDLTTALAGPFATLLLGGLGARVIKLETHSRPDSSRTNAPYLGRDGLKLAHEDEDDVSISTISRLRNKQGITLNLKHPAARDVFADLVRRADVVVDNFSRGTLERLGVGYAFGSQINPRIVYCSITGFGIEGETGSGKAMDAIIQALSGAMYTSGGPDDPPVRIGVPFGDLTAPLFAVIGVLSAVHQARRTGQGQQVDVSMLGATERTGIPLRTGTTVPRLAPFGIFRTRDGYVAICAPTDAFARGVFAAIGRPDLSEDQRFGTRDLRVSRADELHAAIEAWTSTFTKREALERLEAAGVPCAEVREPRDALRDPRVVARRETVQLEHPLHGPVDDVYGNGLPIRFTAAEAGFDQPPPRLGQHNDVVYGDLLGYSAERREQLRAEGVI